MPETTDDELRDILSSTRTIAVLGIKADPSEDAHHVPAYLQEHGYRIVPVNPKLDRVLGERAVATLRDAPPGVDLVDVFRASQNLPAHVDEILAMEPRPRVVWLQLGIRHDAATARLEAAGIRVVVDRCILIEHRRLLGARRS
jgi:predicted CoA-binding protein